MPRPAQARVMPDDTKPGAPAPPEFYSRTYFETRCGGCAEYHASGGRELDPIRAFALDLVAPRRGEWVLDLGSGRAELCAAMTQAGARVVGVDFSRDALAMARETAQRLGTPYALVCARAEALPLRDASLDATLATDIVEHLPDADLRAAVREVCRSLKPGGRFVVHTAPTRAFLTIGQHVKRLLQWLARETVAPLLTYESELVEAGHSNIHSRASLNAALMDDFPSPKVFYAFSDPRRPGRRFAAMVGLAALLGFNLWALARRPEEGS
ncbi:MAG: class I SAM-dependent methyltransferase [Gemmatimonadota bacterium]